jgi:hypothetical protein
MSKVTGVLAILLLLSFASSAQISKGSYLIGGNGSYKKTRIYFPNDESFRQTNLSLAPNVGRFFFNQIAAGIALQYDRYETKRNAVPPQGSSYGDAYWTFGPFARIYLLKSASKINFLADGRIGWQYNRDISGPGRAAAIYIGNSYQVFGGPAVFLNRYVALELLGGYTGFITKSNQANDNRAFEARLGIQVHLPR